MADMGARRSSLRCPDMSRLATINKIPESALSPGFRRTGTGQVV